MGKGVEMKNSGYIKYVSNFLSYAGGALVLLIFGLGLLLWAVYEILVPTPKVCTRNWLTSSTNNNIPNNFSGLALIGHIGGPVQSVFTTATHAYVGIGPEFAILDIEDPAHPRRQGYLVLPDKVTDIYVDGHYAYAAVGRSGMRIIDVSNPNAPSEAGFYVTTAPVNEIVVSKGYAYLPIATCNSGGLYLPDKCAGALQIVDVSRPDSPVQRSCQKTSDLPISMAADENYAYFSSSKGNLVIMDISLPGTARKINAYNTDFFGDVKIAGDHLYMATRDDKFRILDVSNPSFPRETGRYDSLNAIGGTRNAIDTVVVSGKYAYVTVEDTGIQILDISDPAQPTLVGTYNVEGVINQISHSSNHIYAATDSNGLQVIDVVNPVNPKKIGAYESPHSVINLEVQNNLLYAAAGENGLRIIDASNPAMPVEIGNHHLSQEIRNMAGEYNVAFVTGLSIEGSQAYLAIKDIGIRVVEISNPAAPVESGFFPVTNGINDIAVHDNYAYISTGVNGLEIMNLLPNTSAEPGSYNIPYAFKDVAVGNKYAYILGDKGLLTVDLSNPEIFTQVDFYELNANILNGVEIDAEYAYIASSDGLQIIGLSDTSIPTEEKYAELEGLNLEDLVIEENYVYAAGSHGLSILDVSSPLQPVVKGSCKTENWTDDLAKAGNYVYLVVRDEGIWIIDVSDPGNPIKVGLYIPPRSARGVAATENYAYIAAGGDGLRIVDASNPAAPIETGFLENIGFAEEVAIAGNFAYISHRDGLVIADITNPYKPTKVREYGLVHSPWRQGITLAGNYAYLPSHDDGLSIIDISRPEASDDINQYEGSYETTGIDIQGDYAYIAADTSGLRLVDISNPSSIAEVGFYEESAAGQHDVAVSEHLAYIANLSLYASPDLESDLSVIDISNPDNPRKIDSYELPGATWGVAVAGEYIYIAAGTDGIFIFHLPTPP
jgi:hypothetical protein